MPAALKFGRLPGVVPVGLRDLTYYSAGPLPAPPPSVAVPPVADWGMDGNDNWGDCGVAALQHGFMGAAADVHQGESFPSDQQVVDYYLKYTGGEDSGVVLSQFLAYARRAGYYGHTVQAYAPVAVHDVPTLQFAINAYDFAYVGINVTEGMMDAVQGDGPWTWTAADLTGETVGGHCIILAGYDSEWLYGVTWGSTIRIAYPAWHQMSDEAWALIVGEEVKAGTDGHGLNLAALQADLSQLAKPIPPQPAPQPPAPPAPPQPDPLLQQLVALIREVAQAEQKGLQEITQWLAKHGL